MSPVVTGVATGRPRCGQPCGKQEMLSLSCQEAKAESVGVRKENEVQYMEELSERGDFVIIHAVCQWNVFGN